MIFTQNDINLVKKLIDIKNRGYYASGQQVTELYNRCLQKNVQSTNCSSCIRQRIGELEKALHQYEALEAQRMAQEALLEADPTPTKAEEKQANTEEITEEKPKEDATKQRTPKKKSTGKGGRKKRKEQGSV